MDQGLSALLGAFIGGALVLLGDWTRRRAERRDRTRERLREATADVLASYLRARTRWINARERGIDADIDDLWPVERQLALARFFTLPGSQALAPQVRALSEASRILFEHAEGEEKEALAARQLAAIRAVEAAARELG